METDHSSRPPDVSHSCRPPPVPHHGQTQAAVSVAALEQLGTAPLGQSSSDERAAESVCIDLHESEPATELIQALPFYAWSGLDGSETQPCTAPPTATTTQPQQPGMSGVRVAGRGTDSRPCTAPTTVAPTQPQQPGMSRVRVAGKEKGSQQPGTSQSGTHLVLQVNQSLNPDAAKFVMRDASLVCGGQLRPDLDKDWAAVQGVQPEGSGHLGDSLHCLWGDVSHREVIPSGLKHLQGLSSSLMNVGGLTVPASPILRASSLKDRSIILPEVSFTDKFLPAPAHPLLPREIYTADYFKSLHNCVAAAGIRSDGSTYPALTPNFLGARIKLKHVGMKPDRWRYHLLGYEHADVVQHIEYGFPLGLNELPELKSSLRNHGSSYAYYTHVDKFITEEIQFGGLAGPFDKVPWWDTMISPLMTAPKKPSSRRTVFDASFGDYSLNNATPGDVYLGQPCVYTFPKIDDFRRMVLRCGRGCFLWKRDLSRYFLQIPLDPVEYHRVGLIWRGLFFFFVGLAFGLRHSGLAGQRLTDALSWIHQRQGLETAEEKLFNVANYSDDLGGCETNLERAMESFTSLKVLMEDLGLEESGKKAEAPANQMVYLGVMFDSSAMEMRVPPDKLAEIKSEIGQWSKKTTITRKNLQSLLGKLFWVSRVVRLARIFMGRLLQQLRDMSSVGDNVKVKLSADSRKDLKWWSRYLEHFNGIQMIFEEDPFILEISQLLDTPLDVYAGDATPMGGGGWHGKQYWSRMLPIHLQDPAIPIHVKEFWILVVSAKLWGEGWSGRAVTLFCDNGAVVDTVNHKKPRDPALLSLLREFFFVAVTYKFIPVVRKISTKDNFLADHISRRFDHDAASRLFSESGLANMQRVTVPDKSFMLTDSW